MNGAKRRAIFVRLQEANPAPRTELDYKTPFELLIAVILSAQATDKSVNKATASLFRAANTPAAILAFGVKGLTPYVKSIGLYNSKAKNIITTSRALLEEHGGEVPRTREALERLPGVGRKTANVVLNVAFGAAHDSRRHPRFSRRQPHRPRARQDGAGGGGQAHEIRAARISSRCAPLADPARPLRLHGAQTQAAPLCNIADLCEYRHKTKAVPQ